MANPLNETANQITPIGPRNGNRLVKLADWLKPQPDNNPEAKRPIGLGLAGKLLGLTFLFVMLAEVLIFVPSIANFRVTWLTERISAAQIAALAAKAAPDGQLPDMLRDELLNTANVRVISERLNDNRKLILSDPMPGTAVGPFDLRKATPFRKSRTHSIPC